MKHTKKHESGRSMIEMVCVLAVMGLLTAGAFVLIQSGMSSQKRSRAADEISAIVAEMANIDLKKLEKSMENGVATPAELGLPTTTPFGSKTQYSLYTTDALLKNNQFNVAITNLGDSCSAMAKRAWSNDGQAACDGSGNLVITYTKDGTSATDDKCAECKNNGGKCSTACALMGCC